MFIIHSLQISKFLTGSINAWTFDIDLPFEKKQSLLNTLAQSADLADKALAQTGINPLCDKQLPLRKSYKILNPETTQKLSTILQFTGIYFQIQGEILDINLSTLDQEKLNQLCPTSALGIIYKSRLQTPQTHKLKLTS